MAIDFFEKEVERLQSRFNNIFGDQVVYDIRSRYLCILAICRASLLSRDVKGATDEKKISEITRTFCQIREILNKFFDLVDANTKGRGYANRHEEKTGVAGG